MEPRDLAVIDGILDAIRSERERQHAMWGRQKHKLPTWMLILGEEYGEICNAIIDGDNIDTRTELMQLAAVAVQIIEALDRGDC